VSQALGLADLPVGRGELFLGKYLIGETLGAGGMGVVVAAEHVQLGQKVAVKFLSLELRQNADGVARFLREARAAARIRSEHVVRVVDVDGATGDVCYMVMELLDGEDLARVVRLRGRLSTEVAVGYILQACEAIAEAHELGIVHRDLKPSNLFVTYRRDGSPLLKVLDFGISKAVDAGAGGVGDGRERPTDLTSSRMVLGSPMYMSPEQVRSTKNVDARTDVWALGTSF
jgi:serine/threonine-protein kinase